MMPCALFLVSGWPHSMEMGLLGGLACGITVFGIRYLMVLRRPKTDRERLRRLGLHARGRMTDATVLEITPEAVLYSYEVSGVGYTTSQELRGLQDFLPGDLSIAVGQAWVKYLPENPASSIILCERWSGIPARGAPSSCDAQLQRGA
jgi:hypothetical protein